MASTLEAPWAPLVVSGLATLAVWALGYYLYLHFPAREPGEGRSNGTESTG